MHALEVALGLLQPPQRFGPARLVVGDAGRFLEQRPPLVGAQREGLIDKPLADDGVGALGQPAGCQQVGHVLQAHVAAVDEVLVVAGAEGAAGDLDLAEVDGQPAVAVVEGDGCLGHAGARPLLAAGEDHVGRAPGAQRAIALLAQHPAQRIGDIALAAAVGPNDGRDTVVEDELRARGERLIPLEAEFVQLHCHVGNWETRRPDRWVARDAPIAMIHHGCPPVRS